MYKLISCLLLQIHVLSSSGCIVFHCEQKDNFSFECCFENYNQDKETCFFQGEWFLNKNVQYKHDPPANCSNTQACTSEFYSNNSIGVAVQMKKKYEFPTSPAYFTIKWLKKCCSGSFVNQENMACSDTQTSLQPTLLPEETKQPVLLVFAGCLAPEGGTTARTTDNTDHRGDQITAALSTVDNNLLIPANMILIASPNTLGCTFPNVVQTSSSTIPILTPTESVIDVQHLLNFTDDSNSSISLDRLDETITNLVYSVPSNQTSRFHFTRFEALVMKRKAAAWTGTELRELHLKQASLQRVDFNRSDVADELGVVIAAFNVPSKALRNVVRDGDIAKGVVENELPLTGLPLLSVTLIDISRRKKLAAQVVYELRSAPNSTTYEFDQNRHLDKSIGTWKIKSTKHVCQYFDLHTRRLDSKGCSLGRSDKTSVSCFCNHTTVFAVLLSVRSYRIPITVERLSFVVGSTSVAALILTVVVLVCVRKSVKSDRTMIQINLSIALLFFHLFSLVHDAALRDKLFCRFVTVAVHYFMLATGMWMALEGVTLFLKTTKGALTMSCEQRSRAAKITLALGWCLPAIVVSLAAGILSWQQSYMKKNPLHDKTTFPLHSLFSMCWINPKNGALLGAVILPLACLYILNILIATRVACFVYTMSAKTDVMKPSCDRDGLNTNVNHLKVALKSIVLLFPALGIPQIFAFLTAIEPYEASITFMYINVLLNGLQGLMLFVVYCLMGSDVRNAFLRNIYKRFPHLQQVGRNKAYNTSSGNAAPTAASFLKSQS